MAMTDHKLTSSDDSIDFNTKKVKKNEEINY